MKLITCENLTLGYEGKAILSGLNFTVNSGDYLCIVGENGKGKRKMVLLRTSPDKCKQRFQTGNCRSDRRWHCRGWKPGNHSNGTYLLRCS